MVCCILKFARASKFFRSRIDPLKITPYVYKCLENLDAAQDQPTDICATSLVRLQLIAERINQGPWNTEYGVPEYPVSYTPPILYVKSIQQQLKDFRSSIPPEIGTRGRNPISQHAALFTVSVANNRWPRFHAHALLSRRGISV